MSESTILVGDGLFGRVIDAAGLPIDGLGQLSDVQPVGLATTVQAPATATVVGETGMWETGIKVLDFYAPLARGRSIALVASPGVGMVVMVSELIHRLAEQHNGCAVFAKLDSERNELSETIGQLRESGVERRTVLVAGQYRSSPAERQRLVQTALTIAEGLAMRGRDVLLILDDGLVIDETVELLRDRAQAPQRGLVTTLCCFWRQHESAPALGPSAEALLQDVAVRIVFSRDLARQSIWPAVDACASHSQLLVEGSASAEQLRSVAAARALLCPDRPLDASERERAQKLLLFQSQPFFVAETFTARPAEYVPASESVRTFAGISAGLYDQTAADTLRFVGKAPDSTAS